MAMLLASCALALSSASSLAHHSFAQFDTERCLSIEGTVRNIEMSYPHVWLWLDVPNARGVAEAWGFEGASPVVLQRAGWPRPAPLKAGDKVTVRYSPLRDGRHGGAFVSVKIPDGRELAGGSPVCKPRR